jgi:hypothetical protein
LLEYARKWAADPDTAGELRRFKSVKKLAKYSDNEDLIYPKKGAKKQGALRFLLRGLFGKRGLGGKLVYSPQRGVVLDIN